MPLSGRLGASIETQPVRDEGKNGVLPLFCMNLCKVPAFCFFAPCQKSAFARKIMYHGDFMKKLLSGLFFFIAVIGVSAQNRSIISIVNNTGYAIRYMYISPSSSNDWGQEILGNNNLARLGIFHYQLPQTTSGRNNVYDIKLENNEGNIYVKWQVRIPYSAIINFSVNDMVRISDPAAPVPPSAPVPQSMPQPLVQPVTPTAVHPPTPQPAASSAFMPGNESVIRTAIVDAAQRYIGARYVYGSQSPPSKFDCSGLVNQVYKDAANIVIPRSSSEIWEKGKRLNSGELAPGDIIVYSENGRTPSHVSIYINSTEMIHAVSAGRPTGVIRGRQDSGSWPQKILGYVTFVGIPSTVSRNAKGLAVSEIALEITGSLQHSTDSINVQAGSALSFYAANNSGSTGEFTFYFYRVGASRADGETETVRIRTGETGEGVAFLCTEAGLYRLEITGTADSKTLLEYNFNAEE